MIVTRYRIEAPIKLTAAVVADLHGEPTDELYKALEKEKPDVILCPGDLCTVADCENADPAWKKKRLQEQERALLFLRNAGQIAPVYYSRGNHEWGIDNKYRERVREAGTVLLENKWAQFRDGVFIGGQSSARHYGREKLTGEPIPPDAEWLKQDAPDGYKILLCHHPEYFSLVKNYTDLCIAGHAHGGQWRFFGRGVFAPGQGLFPKYTKGVYHDKMIVSAGLSNETKIPRFFNPIELVIAELG